MSEVKFSEEAWNQYVDLQSYDKKMCKKINKLIKDISRNHNSGIGHPERLKDNLSGLYSRRIDEKNRLVYNINGDVIEIKECKNHYYDK